MSTLEKDSLVSDLYRVDKLPGFWKFPKRYKLGLIYSDGSKQVLYTNGKILRGGNEFYQFETDIAVKYSLCSKKY